MNKNLVIFEQESQTKDIILAYLSDFDDMKVDKFFDNYDVVKIIAKSEQLAQTNKLTEITEEIIKGVIDEE